MRKGTEISKTTFAFRNPAWEANKGKKKKKQRRSTSDKGHKTAFWKEKWEIERTRIKRCAIRPTLKKFPKSTKRD